MLTENEVGQLLEIQDVRQVVEELHQAFLDEEDQFQELSLHDFLSGMLMIPSVALARVDGITSLFEELSLNKKARRFSKGGFFLQQDPVVKMVIHMQARLQHWESRFITAINKIIKVVIPEVAVSDSRQQEKAEHEIFLNVVNSSYILVKFLETFFLPEGEEITNTREVTTLEHQKILSIGDQLQLSQISSFKNFIKTFEVK